MPQVTSKHNSASEMYTKTKLPQHPNVTIGLGLMSMFSVISVIFIAWGIWLLSLEDRLLDNPIIPATFLEMYYSTNNKTSTGLFQLNPEVYFKSKQENITFSNCLCDLECENYINKTNYFSVTVDSNYSIISIAFNNKESHGKIMTSTTNDHASGGFVLALGLLLFIAAVIFWGNVLQTCRKKNEDQILN